MTDDAQDQTFDDPPAEYDLTGEASRESAAAERGITVRDTEGDLSGVLVDDVETGAAADDDEVDADDDTNEIEDV